MYAQRLVSFKFQRPQITVVTNHPCYDTLILNPNIETELHGIAVVLLCDELTGSRHNQCCLPSKFLFASTCGFGVWLAGKNRTLVSK